MAATASTRCSAVRLDQLATGGDTLWGGNGADWVIQRVGKGVIYGEGGNDNIETGRDNDTLYGGSGNDRIVAGLASDTLYGGAGNDDLWGDGSPIGVSGSGPDTIVWGSGSDRDRLRDYAEADNIRLDGLARADVSLARQGGDLFITSKLDAGDAIRLEGFYSRGLDQVRINGKLEGRARPGQLDAGTPAAARHGRCHRRQRHLDGTAGADTIVARHGQDLVHRQERR